MIRFVISLIPILGFVALLGACAPTTTDTPVSPTPDATVSPSPDTPVSPTPDATVSPSPDTPVSPTPTPTPTTSP